MFEMIRKFACLATSILMAGCSLEPRFGQREGVRGYSYTEPANSDFRVEFHGDFAVFAAEDGRPIVTRFVSTILPRFADRYEGEGYMLTLDPEACLRTADGKVRGPCS